MHLAFTFYLISIREYANAQCLSNLINLFLRQSRNVNQSCATSIGTGADQGSENPLKYTQAAYWNTVSSLFPSFGTLIQTKALTSLYLADSQKQKWKKKKKAYG